MLNFEIMKNKYLVLMLMCLLLIQSCADLNRVSYFKASSDKWRRNAKKLHISIFDTYYPDRCDYFSYTYNGKNQNIVIYPLVQNIELLWGPLIIPFIPGPSILSTSGKYSNFELKIQQNYAIPPDNIICIFDGKEVYPNVIHMGLKSNKSEKISLKQYYWKSDSTEKSPYEQAKNWGNFISPNEYIQKNIESIDINYPHDIQTFLIDSYKEYIISDTTASVFYTYEYNIKHSCIKEIEIYFKDNSAPPLLLKRKKGLQYALTWFLIYR
jgi:hypothetical protein